MCDLEYAGTFNAFEKRWVFAFENCPWNKFDKKSCNLTLFPAFHFVSGLRKFCQNYMWKREILVEFRTYLLCVWETSLSNTTKKTSVFLSVAFQFRVKLTKKNQWCIWGRTPSIGLQNVVFRALRHKSGWTLQPNLHCFWKIPKTCSKKSQGSAEACLPYDKWFIMFLNLTELAPPEKCTKMFLSQKSSHFLQNFLPKFSYWSLIKCNKR